MRYIALIESLSGCDNSIACGKDWLELEAKDIDSALEELHSEIIGKPDDDYEAGYDRRFWEENRLIKVVLLQVSDEADVPILDWYIDVENKYTLRQQADEEQAERREYERLKARFG